MTLVPVDRPLPGPTGYEDAAGDTMGPPRDPAGPGFFGTLGAAVRQDNIIGSGLSAIVPPDPLEREQGYDTWSDIKGTRFEPYADRFLNIFNSRAAEAMKAQIDMETQDRQTLHDAGFLGTVLSMGAGLVDPTILLPGGAIVKAGRGGAAVLRSAANVGVAAMAQAALQEGVLQATQETRPLEQSAFAIGGSAILGAAIGGTVSRLLGRSEFNRLAGSIEREIADKSPLPADLNHLAAEQTVQDARSLSAAAAPRDTLDDLTIAGRAAGGVGKVSGWMRLNPLMRALDSPSSVYRGIAEQMMENPIYLKKNLDDRASALAVETLMKQAQGQVALALDETRALWTQLRKAGEQVSYDDFKNMIGRAMRRGDEAEFNPAAAALTGVIESKVNDAVARAARTWRQRVFDPLKQQAIKTGLLPEDVSVDTAASYFTRLYNRPKIESQPGRFREVVGKWVQDKTDKAVAALTRGRDERVARIQQTIGDLELEGPARITKLEELRRGLADYQAANGLHVSRAEDIGKLRYKMVKAKAAGEAAKAAQHEADLKVLRDEGGAPFRDYLNRVRAMQRRINVIRDNIAGQTEAVDRARLQQADVESQNVERLYRLKAAVDRYEAQIARLDPELHAEKIADLREELLDIIERSEKAQDRIGALEERAAGGEAKAGNRAEQAKAAETRRQERIDRIGQRIEALEDIDPEAAIAEIRAQIETRITEGARRVEAGGKRLAELAEQVKRGPEEAEALKQRVDDLKARAQKVQEDWHQRTRVEMGEGYVEDIVDSIVSQLTGRDARAVPYNIVPTARGPLKERTFDIPDELIEDFLESDIEQVGRRYSRIMAADTELAARFGSPDMRDQVRAVHEDYRRLAQRIEDLGAATPEQRAAMSADDRKLAERYADPARREKALRTLAQREKNDVTDLEAVRDALRGQYKVAENATPIGRAVRLANQFNYLRAMGGAVLGSLTDAARPMMVHGLTPFMQDGIAPLIRNLKAVKMAAREGKLAGTATEMALQSRIAELAELTDPYAHGHPVERWMANATHVFSKLNGLALWTDVMKDIASTMTQNRILRNVGGGWDKLAARERQYLAMLGIDQPMAERIAAQFGRHGQEIDGVKIAGTEAWDDIGARRAYRAALAKDVDSIIVTPGVGDKPLLAYTPVGKALLQFKSYTLASHQRVLMRGLQESPYGFVNGIVSSAAIGMLITYLKAVESNRVDQLNTNPGFWIAEGLDRSGIFGLLFEASNTFEKWGAPGFKTGAQALFPGQSQKGPASRYASRSDIAALLGPTADLGDTMIRLIRSMGDGKLSEGDVNSIRRLLPYSTLPGIRSGIDYGVMPQLREAVR